MRQSNTEWLGWLLVVLAFVGFVIGANYLMRTVNASTLHTQVINPVNGVQCVVVSATESTSVDCWKVLE